MCLFTVFTVFSVVFRVSFCTAAPNLKWVHVDSGKQAVHGPKSTRTPKGMPFAGFYVPKKLC